MSPAGTSRVPAGAVRAPAGVVRILAGTSRVPYNPAFVPAGNRNGIANATGTIHSGNFWRQRVNCNATLRNIRGRYWNGFVNSGATETGNANAVTIAAAIESPIGGTIYPGLINGNPTYSAASNEIVDIQFDPSLVLTPASTYRTRFWIDGGPTGLTCFGMFIKDAIDNLEFGTSVVNKTLTGTVAPVTGVPGNGIPDMSLIFGETTDNVHTVAVQGDSLAFGTGESRGTGGDAFGNVGYIERMLGPANYGFLNLGIPGLRASQVNTSLSMAKRTALMAGVQFTHLIDELGRNDVDANLALATIIANLNAANAVFTSIYPSMKVIECTITPETTSNDNYITVSGQIVSPNQTTEDLCLLLNAAIMGGQTAPNVLNTRGVAGDPSNQSVWNVTGASAIIGGWPFDTRHPNQTLGSPSMAAGLLSQLLALLA